MWRHSQGAAQQLGALPMEVLQAAFWSLDPERTVRKFAAFGRLDPASAEARRFILRLAGTAPLAADDGTAIRATLEARDRVTPDLGGEGRTESFADAIISRI